MDSRLQSLFRSYDANPQDIDAAGKLIAALRRIHNQDPPEAVTYQLRNFPCNITSDDNLWAVSGAGPEGAGVLEWCIGKVDAEFICDRMGLDPRYSNLHYHKWEQLQVSATPAAPDGWGDPIGWDELPEEYYNEHSEASPGGFRD